MSGGGGTVGWGTALQVGRLRVRFPILLLEFFVDIILPGRAMALGLTQPLTEMSTRNIFLRGKGGRCVWLTAFIFMCQLSWNLGSSNSWSLQGLSRTVMGLLYLLCKCTVKVLPCVETKKDTGYCVVKLLILIPSDTRKLPVQRCFFKTLSFLIREILTF